MLYGEAATPHPPPPPAPTLQSLQGLEVNRFDNHLKLITFLTSLLLVTSSHLM